MELRKVRFKSVDSTNSPAVQTSDADVNDLRSALKRRGTTSDHVATVLENYQEARAKLQAYSEQQDRWLSDRMNATNQTKSPAPTLPKMPDLSGLPEEFAVYWQGAVAWHQGRTNDARTVWTQLLRLPPSERPFKSTWAVFMLGKSFDDTESSKAIGYYRQVRELAHGGFADSLGLAASSIGWEARVEFHRHHYLDAIHLYLDQLSSGDWSAYVSLRWVASAALTDNQAPLKELAGDAECRRVITAYILAGGYGLAPIDVDSQLTESIISLAGKAPLLKAKAPAMHKLKQPALAWLEAVESANIQDVESAEQFALAAYQSGHMDLAQRWVTRAWRSPLAQWLQAKLHLRDGKLDAAAALLARVCRNFPAQLTSTNSTHAANLLQSLHVADFEDDYFPKTTPGNQALGELGVLLLARREYTEALDCLFRAGFWTDAAYIAERVLTLEELQTYLKRNWPEPPIPAGVGPDSEDSISARVAALHELLARRLARDQRGAEAASHFTGESRHVFEQVQGDLRTGANTNLPPAQRAAALWRAAQSAREHGMELFGTEVGPDWAVHGGSFEFGPNLLERSTGTNVARASGDELRRAERHTPTPDTRFHYRYTAAAMAWEAAKLMPDNSEETARVLCTAGSWLKTRDPKAADVFYKALVRRCRKTEIGREADRKRWFPILDEAGRFVPEPTK